MKKMLKRRSGFTLVELLIVIIIIGILAGAMMMLVGSGTDRAEATKIISDLRSLKGAALMYYADHPTVTEISGDVDDLLGGYMDKKLSDGNYVFDDASGQWFVGKTGLPGTAGSGVRGVLATNPKDTGLLAAMASGDYAGGDAVYMRAR